MNVNVKHSSSLSAVRVERCLMLLGIVLVSYLPVRAQDYPHIEFFGGGSLNNANIVGRENFTGWQISAAFNPHQRVRLIGDFGGQHEDTNITWQGQPIVIRNYQVLFGPQFTWRRKRVTWFAHPLFGVGAAHFVTPSGDVPATDFGFATAVGGGADVNVGRLFAIRVFQADYVLSHLSPQLPGISPLAKDLPPLNDWQRSFRVGFGVVVRFARRGGGE